MSRQFALATLICLWPLAISRAEERFPYTIEVTVDEASIRSGPGAEYYACDKLAKGETVHVFRHDPHGWLAIRPPQGSYSLVAARRLKETGEDLAIVKDEHTVAWVASKCEPEAGLLWQVKLNVGETVELLGVERRDGIAGETERLWRRISPPAGEFRWIHRRDVAASSPPASTEPAVASDKARFQAATRLSHALATTPESLMDAIEVELDRMASKDRASWNFDVLRENTQRVIAAAPSADVAARAGVALEKMSQLESKRQSSAIELTSLRQITSSPPSGVPDPDPIFNDGSAPGQVFDEPPLLSNPPMLSSPPHVLSDVGVCQPCNCTPPWTHRTGVFAEYLYLRPRDSRVAYAEIIDGPTAGQPNPNLPVPFGQLGVVDPDYSSGYQVGFTFAPTCSSSFVVAYTQFESDTSDAIATDVATPFVLRSLVVHPGVFNAATDFQMAQASYDIDYDHLDVDYRALLWGWCHAAINYRFGARLTRKDQNFRSQFINGVGEAVQTDLDFEGGGLRFGLDGESYSSSRRWMAYARGIANFIAGEFSGRYRLGRTVDPEIVDIGWEEGRIISILEFELGVGWQSQSGRLQARAGYLVSAWYNTVGTDQFVESVQTNDFVDVGGLMTFDGLTARLEFGY